MNLDTSPTENQRWRREWTAEFLPGAIAPVPMHRLYRIGLPLVALILVLLQLVYVALIASTWWLTWRYSLLIPGFFDTIRVNALTIALVLSPVVAGLTTGIFLLKPLFSRQRNQPDLITLQRQDQPDFFEFVDRLCAAVHAPAPKKINFDLQANASAGLNGGWKGLWNGDLVLTVGLPLVEGLTLRQMTGVMAHEFGHFSQKAGLRLHFLIATCRQWFARVAYERDEWDSTLDEWYENENWYVKAMAGSAKITIAAGRRILRVLLNIGNRAGAWFSRQMEFDADAHEARLVGEDVFVETTHRLEELGIATTRAWHGVDQTWSKGKLPIDFPMVVSAIQRNAIGWERESLSAHLLSRETDRWDSHPAPKDRIESVRNQTGIVPPSGSWGDDLPASVLFSNYAVLRRQATKAHFAMTLADEVQTAKWVDGTKFANEQIDYWNTRDSLPCLFGNSSRPQRWFQILERPGELTLQVQEDSADNTYWALLQQWLDRRAGLYFLKAGGLIEPTEFQLTNSEIADGEREVDESFRGLTAEIEVLKERFASVSNLLAPNPTLRQAYAVCADHQRGVTELRACLSEHRVLKNNLRLLSAANEAVAVETSEARLEEQYQRLLSGFKSNEYLASNWERIEEESLDEKIVTLLEWSDLAAEKILYLLLKEAQ